MSDDMSEDKQTRPETGPMKFGEDWTGLFLRGDSAVPLSMYLRKVLDDYAEGHSPSPFDLHYAKSIVELLESSIETPNRTDLQRMKPFEECTQKEP